jgi:hypothetical protein
MWSRARHDVAQGAHVFVRQRVEQQAAHDPDVTRQHLGDEEPARLGSDANRLPGKTLLVPADE